MISNRKKILMSSRSKRRRIAEEVEYSNQTSFTTSNINILVENPITEFHSNNNVAISSPNNTQAEKSIQNLIFSNNRQSDSVQIVKNLLDSENSREICSPAIEESFLSFNETSPCDETRLSLRKWAVDYNIPHHALNGLLSVLKQHKCFKSLPKDSRTLMHNIPKNTTNFYSIEPGLYYHFGVEKGIKLNINGCLESDNIELVIGIDGLPLFKSSSD